MKNIRSFISRAFDAVRLAGELDAARDEIAELNCRIREAKHAPSFVEVSKNFDATELFKKCEDRVIEDITPFIKHDALRFLQQGFKKLHKQHRILASADVAFDCNARVYHVRFDIQRAGTSLMVVNYD